MYYGQALQDKFVLHILKYKKNGKFLELGANDAMEINNTYALEKHHGWTGIMVEYDPKHEESYKQHRPNSTYHIGDATKVDYKKLLEENNMPRDIDYLQIDLDAGNGSTMEALVNLHKNVLGTYRFATITFEHDYYCAGDHRDTREKSRAIFASHGYVPVFLDIHDKDPKVVYEDWYVHPDLVDMEYVKKLQGLTEKRYITNNLTGNSLDWRSICYEDDIKITYTIQVCNESRELYSLLNFLTQVIDYVDNIHVVVDTNNVTEKVRLVLKEFKKDITVFERPFDNFPDNATFHFEKATGDYIFGIDADEMPQYDLIKQIKPIIEKTQADVLWVPRMNIHPGATQDFIQKTNFQLNNVGFINWPDYQGRVSKNVPHIKWTKTTHTKLTGTDKMVRLPPMIELGLWHIKSVEKQNSRWNEDGDICGPSQNNLYDLLM